MTPKKIAGGNMWRLLKGEFIIGDGGEVIPGPCTVRVQAFPEHKLFSVQHEGGQRFAELRGTDFESLVQTESEE